MLAVGAWSGIARGKFFQFREAAWAFPAEAADFLKAHRISTPLFNTYEHGGYLIWRLWPDQRVFIDGRALSESVYEDYRRVLHNTGSDPARFTGPRAEVLARYNIGAIVMNSFEYRSGHLYALAVAFARPDQRDWKLVFEDQKSMVFLRTPPAGMQVLDNSRVVDHLEAECRYRIEQEPEYSLCARALGEISFRSGDTERARRLLGLYLGQPGVSDPDAARVYRELVLAK
jgi:hypothetical protein